MGTIYSLSSTLVICIRANHNINTIAIIAHSGQRNGQHGYDQKGRVEVQRLHFKYEINLYRLTLGCNAAKKN